MYQRRPFTSPDTVGSLVFDQLRGTSFMTELLIVLTMIAVVAAAVLEKTPEGVRVNLKRLQPIWESATRKVSESATKLQDAEHERRVSSWQTVGVPESRIEEFNAVWGKAPDGPRNLGYWRTAMDCENQEATEWRRVFNKVEACQPWQRAGVTPHDAQTWLGLDREMNPIVARQWMDTGMQPAVAYSWHSRSYTPDTVGKLSAGGLLTYGDATRMLIVCAERGMQFENLNFATWIEAGFQNEIASIFSWMDSGFSASEAAPWHVMRLDAKTSRGWVNAGFSPNESAFWVENNFLIDNAKELFNHGFRASTMMPWRSHWHDVEFVTTWRQVGFTSSEEAQAWADHGFAPTDAAQWRDTKHFKPETALEWSQHQFTPNTATTWKTAGISAERARLWLHGGTVDPRAIMECDQLISKAGLTQELEKTITEICQKIRQGSSAEDLRRFVYLKLPPQGGDIGIA